MGGQWGQGERCGNEWGNRWREDTLQHLARQKAHISHSQTMHTVTITTVSAQIDATACLVAALELTLHLKKSEAK